MTGAISLSGISTAYSHAIVYSGSSNFWSGLFSFGKESFLSFHDSFMYYLFHGIDTQVISGFFMYFALLFGVAYVSSLVFVWWLGSRSGIGGRIHDTFNSSKK